ncbi:MAG: protein kinase [Planctomycetota bacterium]|nr:protein kinase [Planctomycetota bacterium]
MNEVNKQLAGRYEIKKKIGAGAMGQVVEARDQWLNRELAVKSLLSKDNETLRKRFIEEAQITGCLAHPNIVPVHELGQDEEQNLFMAMKLVDGLNLHEVIQGVAKGKPSFTKKYSQRRVLRLFLKICEAMAYAHKAGFLHRDLKPANIMVGQEDEVLVMDWGLAKAFNEGDSVSSDFSLSKKKQFQSMVRATDLEESAADLTQEGSIVGTPIYMSPEQADDPANVDTRADIYSLGAILYELLTYKRPYNGNTVSVLNALFKGPPPRPRVAAPNLDIHPALESIVSKAMARNPMRRYDDALAFAADIEAFLDGRMTSAYKESFGEAVKRVARSYSIYLILLTVTVGLIAGALIYSESVTRNLEHVASEKSLKANTKKISLDLANTETDFIIELRKQNQKLDEPLRQAQNFADKATSALDIDELTDRHKFLRQGENRAELGVQGVDSVIAELTKEDNQSKIRSAIQTLKSKIETLSTQAKELEQSGISVDTEIQKLQSALNDQFIQASIKLKQEADSIDRTLIEIQAFLDDSLAEMYISREPERLIELFKKQKSGIYKGVRLKFNPSKKVLYQARALIRKDQGEVALTLINTYLKESGAMTRQLTGNAKTLTKLFALRTMLTQSPKANPLKQQKESFDSAIAVDPSAHWLFIYRAEIFARMGRFADARKDYKKASALYPIDAWIELSRMSHLISDYAARDLLVASTKAVWSFAPRVYEIDAVSRMKQLWRHGEYEKFVEALQSMSQNVSLTPRQALQYSARGGLIISRFDDVEKDARALLKEHPNDAIGLGCLAEALLFENKLVEATKVAETGLAIEPEDGRLNYVRGEIYCRKDSYKEAIPFLRQGARPSLHAYRWERLARAIALAEEPELLKEGVEAGYRALSLINPEVQFHHPKARPLPEDTIFYETMALLREKQGKLAQASLHIARAIHSIEQKPKKIRSEQQEQLNKMDSFKLELGRLYEAMELKEEAKSIYLRIKTRKFKKDEKDKEKPLKTKKKILKTIEKRLKKL